jgi:hypothetical protein
MSRHYTLDASLLFALLGGVGLAQSSIVHTVHGEDLGEEFGGSVTALGDVDGDQVDDFAVGAPEDSDLAGRAGKVVVFSGADASVLHTFKSADGNSNFGRSIDSAGDVNGDGHDDILVGKPWQILGGIGKVYTYSGADGILLREWTGAAAAAFGHDVANMGDLNGDGIDEVGVSAYLGNGGLNPGIVYVLSGADGSTIYSFPETTSFAQFGFVVASGDDVDGDGFHDLIVTSKSISPEGLARVFSGQTGALIWEVLGATGSDQFGRAADMLGDLDGDGRSEFAVAQTGRILVYSGMTGTILFSVSGNGSDAWGHSVAGVGDVDADTVPDIAVGAIGDDDLGSACGAAFVHSGVDGSLIVTYYGIESNRLFGLAIDGVGDLTGDGIPEILVGGTPPRTSATNTGYARIYSGRCAVGPTMYGAGTPGTGSLVPALMATGCPAPTSVLRLTIDNAVGGASGLVFLAAAPGSIPFAGGALLVAPPFLLSFAVSLSGSPGVAGAGSFTLGNVLPDNTPTGFDVYLQGVLLDAGGFNNLALTNGLQLQFR